MKLKDPRINWNKPAVVKKSGGEQVIAVYGSNFQQGVSVDVVNQLARRPQLSGRQIANQTPNSFHRVVLLPAREVFD